GVPSPAVSPSHGLGLSPAGLHPGHRVLPGPPGAPPPPAGVLAGEIGPALAAPYGDRNGEPIRPATEATLMTEPVPRPTRWPPMAWQTYMAESRFSLMSLSQPGSRMSRNGTAKLAPPALFTTMSTRPSRSKIG